jgi:hypothetical protein
MADHSTIERILLTFTTSVFYLILPLLMLYLVAEAGGPSQTGAMASQGLNNPAKELGMVGNAGTSRAQLRQWWK